MEERIQEYLEALFTKKRLSSSEKELSQEISAHIRELYDIYIELGCSEHDAIDKAIHDMGDPQSISS